MHYLILFYPHMKSRILIWQIISAFFVELSDTPAIERRNKDEQHRRARSMFHLHAFTLGGRYVLNLPILTKSLLFSLHPTPCESRHTSISVVQIGNNSNSGLIRLVNTVLRVVATNLYMACLKYDLLNFIPCYYLHLNWLYNGWYSLLKSLR